jgi:hypothetical protein
MIRKLTLLPIALFMAVSMGFSQEEKSTKITVFKPQDNSPISASDATQQKDVNCIKWNYSLLARGVFLMNYEFPIQKKISAEVGLGLTYRDYLFEFSHSNYFDIGNTATTGKFGLAVEGGVRLYPKDFDNFEGFFVSPVISYRSYSTPITLSPNSSTTQTLSYFTPGYHFVDFQFKIGYSYESLWDDDLLGEVYAGVAIRNATVSYYATNINPNTLSTQYVATKEKLQLPQFLLGFKFGIPF